MNPNSEDQAPPLTLAVIINIKVHADLGDPKNLIWYVDANTDIEDGFENLANHPEAFVQWLQGVEAQFLSGFNQLEPGQNQDQQDPQDPSTEE